MTKRERVIKLHKYLYPGDTSKHTYIDVTGSDIYIQSEVYSNEREILNKEIFKYVGDPSHFSVYYYLFKESYIYYYKNTYTVLIKKIINTKYEKLDKDSIIIEYIESHLLQRFENEALDIAKTKVLEELTKNKLESDLELIKINKDFFDKELSKDYEKFDRKRKLDRL